MRIKNFLSITFILLICLCTVTAISCGRVDKSDTEDSVDTVLGNEADGPDTEAFIDAALLGKIKRGMSFNEVVEILGTEGKSVGSGARIHQYTLTDGRIVKIWFYSADIYDSEVFVSRMTIDGIDQYEQTRPKETLHHSDDYDAFLQYLLAAYPQEEITILVPRLVSDKYEFVDAIDREDSFFFNYAPIGNPEGESVLGKGFSVNVSKLDNSYNDMVASFDATDKDGIAYNAASSVLILNNNGRGILIWMPIERESEPIDNIEKLNQYLIIENLCH